MTRTLLEALTAHNVPLNPSAAVTGGNTIVGAIVEPEDWTPWTDFNYETITRIFRNELGAVYNGSEQQRPLEMDTFANNEEVLDDAMRRFMASITNYALYYQVGSPHLGRGSRCNGEYRPDWSVISAQHFSDQGYANILPGDTKVDAKWSPDMRDTNYTEWRKVMSQITTYMAYFRTRYGFIWTDQYLVVLRLTQRPTGSGIAQGRPLRSTVTYTQGHYRHSSDTSMASAAASSSPFVDDNPGNWEYYDPEYVKIPWNNHGRRLTVNLALWCLSMMATHGDRFMDYSYPGLDTWRRDERGGYVHNTSGNAKRRLSKEDVHQEPDPEAPRRESADNEGSTRHTNFASPAQYELPILPAVHEHESQAGYYEHESNSMAGPSSEAYASLETEPSSQADPWSQAEPDILGSIRSDSPQSVRPSKRMRVTIEKHTLTKKLYYRDANGNKIDTTEKEWTKVDGGYEKRGRRHVYFAKTFPK
ncbi:Uncharacterized protein TPAR_07840 [Tolypocladium paradoxum]|uniref:Uncharacterized protein n=1 Tax=Tolypocladium paradoxum TaxID=94208 RepID=A0A2S4KP24_9HYPO|nr:Uncharacterized protein TPAR_07840 [Tolypocladium paradoxum]